MPNAHFQARRLLHRHPGIFRASEIIAAGIHPRTLYAMRDSGEILTLARGLYRLAAMPPLSDPDLATVALRVPNAVICLTSALALHELTTQIPHQIHIAIKRSARTPALHHPPLHVYRFATPAFEAGIEHRQIDHLTLRLYSPEKTLADCFKYRNQIGLDVALEALRNYRSSKKTNFEKVLQYARICRVENVMRPYLEAIM